MQFFQTFLSAIIDMEEFFHEILPTIEEEFEKNTNNETIQMIQSKKYKFNH